MNSPVSATSVLKPMCVAVVATCVVAACSSESSDGSNHTAPPGPPTTTAAATAQSNQTTAQIAAEAIRAAVPEVTDLIEITEDNDANNMIGRDSGYVAATVIVDSRAAERAESATLQCSREKPGIVCGAGVEQWPDEAAAQKRATYIKTITDAAPIFGTEYQTLKGNLLLRVSGKLKPSEAQAYEAAFTGG